MCLGGTFNVVHEGHFALLKKAFESGDEVHIGLTTDRMASRSRKVPLNEYDSRLRALERALETLAGGKPFFIFPLEDTVGKAATGDFQKIIVSRETLKGANNVNKARKRNGLEPLEIVVVEMVLAHDEEPISSTRVIKKEIGPDGKDNNS